MRVSKLTIRNVLGHEDFELTDLADFTLIEGLNGQGKTSIMEAIRSVTGGGHDATLLRNGAEEGEIVMVLDDETEIRKRITEKGSSTTVRRPEMGNVSAAQTFIRSLIDELNPIDFLAERDELKRTEYFLQALPLELDPKAVTAAIAGTIPTKPADLVGHPLKVLEKLHSRVYEERTGVNREGKAKKASIEQLSGSLTEEPEEDPTEEIERLELERDGLPGDVNDRIEELEATAGDEANAIEAPYLEQISALKEQIEQLQSEMTKKTSAIAARRVAAIQELREKERHRLLEIRLRLDALRAGAQARAAAANTRNVVDGFKAELQTLSTKSQALTQALAQLDAIKLGLMEKMPIKGITIVDGVIHKDGIPWPRVNKAEQVKIAIKLAQLRKKKVPLVCVDNIECLDGPTFKAFRDNAAKSGLQFIVTKVRQDPTDKRPGLQITSSEREAIPA